VVATGHAYGQNCSHAPDCTVPLHNVGHVGAFVTTACTCYDASFRRSLCIRCYTWFPRETFWDYCSKRDLLQSWCPH